MTIQQGACARFLQWLRGRCAGYVRPAMPHLEGTVPTTSFVRSLALYACAAIACIGLLFVLGKVQKLEFSVPMFYSLDAMIHLNWIKNIQDTGWFLTNSRFGAPGVQDFRDFPASDALHHGLILLLSQFASEPGAIFNLYYLLTYPLTTLIALFVFRRLGVSYPVGLTVSLLYTFLPYHVSRQLHLYLAGYFHLPLMVLLALRIYQNRPFLAREDDLRGWQRRDWIAACTICVLTGCGGVYYACFACYFWLFAGLVAVFLHRDWKPLARSTALIAIAFAVFLLNVLPTLLLWFADGHNADMIRRPPSSAELAGLKIIHLLLPIYEHRLGAFRQIELDYRIHLWPNGGAPLCLIGSAGFLFLLARTLLHPGRDKRSLLDALGLFTIAGLILATIGGLGTVFAYVVSPWLRCYERMSIFIAFFALLAVALLLDRAGRRWAATPLRQFAFLGCLLLLLVGGLRDQTPRIAIMSTKNTSEAYHSDAAFVRDVEKQVPAGRMIFQIPTRPFPEALAEPAGIRFDSYDLLRPGIHSRTLRWTGGALRGQEGDLWRKWIDSHSLDQRLALLAQAEFGGICVDCFAFRDEGVELLTDLTKRLGPPTARSKDGRLAFFDLAPFIDSLKSHSSTEEWSRLHERALHPLLIFWRDGFQEEQDEKEVGLMRWADRSSELVLQNGLATPRNVRLRFTLDIPWQEQPVRMRVAGSLFNEELLVGKDFRSFEKVLTLPPGRHRLTIHCDGPRQPLPAFPGQFIAFRIARYSVEDVE